MNVGSSLRKRRSGRAGLALSVLVTALAMGAVAASVEVDLLGRAAGQAVRAPGHLALAVGAFGSAFVLRAVAWRRVVPGLSFGQALSALHLALGANHVLPLRLGEPLRVVSVVRRAGLDTDSAVTSTVMLRAADVLALAVVGVVAAPSRFGELLGIGGWLAMALVAAVAVAAAVRLAATARARGDLRPPRPSILVLACLAWCAESVVIWQAARWVDEPITGAEALLITAVAVAAQVVAIAPGGFGTYEAAAVAAFVALGYDAEPALVAALTAHGVKTAYSLAGGLVALWLPTPGLVGRVRLRAAGVDGADCPPATPAPDDPVVLFMPANNEAASVAACVGRAPAHVAGHPVVVMVVDDGSTDATAAEAERAGADVVRLGSHRGLGAAVAVGLQEAIGQRAAAVAFCDADGEYRPEELVAMVTPILDGSAHYVTGSRFLGQIDHMRPHRRLGNVVLTAWLSLVARTRITDGQTGFRALSPVAAAEAEISHDFNYAQVLTLDLLAKGFRLHEVPITYRFRSQGTSFVRLGPYLRAVVPAVYRQLNRPVGPRLKTG